MSANYCINCSLTQPIGSRSIVRLSKVTSKLPIRDSNSNVTISDAIFMLFGEKIDLNLTMCLICANKLKNVFTSHLDLQKKKTELFTHTSADSLLSKFISRAMTVATITPNPQNVVEHKENFSQTDKIITRKVPLQQRIYEYRKSSRDKQVLCSTIKRIVKNELEKLSSKNTSCFRNEVGKDDPLIIDGFQDELALNAPIVNAILEGMCPKRKEQKEIPRQLSILAIALISHCQLCNRFQKNVGLALRNMGTSLQCFSLLTKLGLCCGVGTAKKTVNSLSDAIAIESAADAYNGADFLFDHSYLRPPSPLRLRKTIPQKNKTKRKRKRKSHGQPPLKICFGLKRKKKKFDSESETDMLIVPDIQGLGQGQGEGQDLINLELELKEGEKESQTQLKTTSISAIASLKRKYKIRSESQRQHQHLTPSTGKKTLLNKFKNFKTDLDLDTNPDIPS